MAELRNVVAEQLRNAYDRWVANGGELRRVKVLTGYAAHARFLAETTDMERAYVVPTCPDVPSPYAFSATKSVMAWKGYAVVVYETRHRRYEVFAVSGPLEVARG
jgi:hypothetical protein